VTAKGRPAVGILGGTFDPVHNAHLAMARAALEHLGLDRVLFIPTGHTRYRPPSATAGAHRAAMLRLAIQAEPRFALDERELRPGASGYTVDTLAALRSELGGAELYLLMGADQYEKLPTWHRPEEIGRLARIAVFGRPGIEMKEKPNLIPMDPMPLSASGIRARVRRGDALDGLVPASVANYIARQGLYR
jgi:nicotinate-nucleotide adenylyltransferase